MVLAYQIGVLKGEAADLAGWVIGSGMALPVDRKKLVDKVGGNLVVSAGKTLKIGKAYVVNTRDSDAVLVTLMYDDDGAGTNEVEVFVVNVPLSTDQILDIYIEIPAEKYVTAKATFANGSINIFGIEE